MSRWIVGLMGSMIAMVMAIAGCASSVAVPQHEADFRLYVDVTPREALILIDDAAVSNGEKTAQVPLEIRAGTRRVTILCEGYHPFRTTLEYVQPGEVYTLKTSLIASEF